MERGFNGPFTAIYDVIVKVTREINPIILPSPLFIRVLVRHPLHITAPKPNIKLPNAIPITGNSTKNVIGTSSK